ncbi:hypothetical protein CsatB_007755 [Cannabis sativa]
MGSCISKCIPQNSHNSENPATSEEDGAKKSDLIQDKLVIISQTPTTSINTKLQNSPLYKIPNKFLPSPPSPSTSHTLSTNSSLSSFTTCPFSTKTTCRSTSTISNSCSSSSTASSSSKDRSFSNDFLWSCYKENPHIIRINSIKQTSTSNYSNKTTSFLSPENVPPAALKKSSVSQKRLRSSSPSSVANDYHHLTRQKSFRRDISEKSKPSGPIISSSRRLTASRSPSPSRRFIGTNPGPRGDNYKLSTHSKRTAPNYSLDSSRRVMNALGNYSDQTTTSYYSRKERSTTSRPSTSPKDISSGDRPIRSSLRNRDLSLNNNTINHPYGTKINGDAMISDQEFDSVLLEDIDNPLISLDCFIFL